jgi:tetratricopeptide (TPR) repeat protein
LAEQGWQLLLQQARAAWGDEQPHAALQLCDRAALQSASARHAAALLRGDILMQLGDAAGALSSYDSVANPSVPDASLDCSRGLALFELARFAEAESALNSALRGDSQLAEAHHALGVISEIMGKGDETEHFRRARRLAPERFELAPRLSTEQFEAVVQKGLERLPERVRTAMMRMTVLVMEMPRLEDLREQNPPISPQSFGMHVALAHSVDPISGPTATQPAVLLFKRNLERACPHETALVQAVRDTVLEEAVAALNLPYAEDLEGWPTMN